MPEIISPDCSMNFLILIELTLVEFDVAAQQKPGIRQQPGITSVIVGCRTPEQAVANAQASDWDLSDQELRTISSLKLSS